VHHILRIDGIGGTLTKRKIVHGIQQIGLPHPILSDETIHLGREIQLHLFKVLVVQYRDMVQNHSHSVYLGVQK
jgi:hypothetical protein